jgi:hypothetical protein
MTIMANSTEESTPAPITHPSFYSDIYLDFNIMVLQDIKYFMRSCVLENFPLLSSFNRYTKSPILTFCGLICLS